LSVKKGFVKVVLLVTLIYQQLASADKCEATNLIIYDIHSLHNQKTQGNTSIEANSRENSQSSSDKIKPHRKTLLKFFYSALRAVLKAQHW
jgi:hypothetical protein